jgi:hypothetical protein
VAERTLFHDLLIGWCVLAVATVPYLFFWSAPYGRHAREGWGPRIPRTLGWVLMEAPSPIGFAALFAIAPRPRGAAQWPGLVEWALH